MAITNIFITNTAHKLSGHYDRNAVLTCLVHTLAFISKNRYNGTGDDQTGSQYSENIGKQSKNFIRLVDFAHTIINFFVFYCRTNQRNFHLSPHSSI